MDIVTQALLGASLAAAVAPSRQRRLAALVGTVAGVLPDADALIQSGEDPLLVLDYHRHFTHALPVIPLGALLAALLLWPLLRRRLGFARLYGYSLAGYGFAGLLDACTSYGTYLLLPFSDYRAAWNVIAVFDPAFTLLLAGGLLLSLRRPASRAVVVGLALAAGYLGIGYLQQQRVLVVAEATARARGHVPERLHAKPTLGNLLLWRTLYAHDGRIHADAVHAGFRLRHYGGDSAPLRGPVSGRLASPASGPSAGPPSGPLAGSLATDVERFRRFADGWLVEQRPGEFGDGRYAMLPTRIDPIWHIRQDADGRTRFVTRHEMSAVDRAAWLAMFLGHDLPAPSP